MNLTDLRENKKSKLATKVLRENFKYDMNLEQLDIRKTHSMLTKVRSLINESKASSRIHSSHRDPAYLKLLMMEQALSGHLRDLRSRTRIVIENEEIQKSQVLLAAQSMIDDIQKMMEQVSKMNVEELNAVVEGIKNSPDFQSSDADQFNTAVGQALTTLQEAVKTAKEAVSGALGGLTGEGGAMPAAPGEESPEMPGMPGEEPDMGEELPELPELPEEPEEEPERPTSLGRERR